MKQIMINSKIVILQWKVKKKDNRKIQLNNNLHQIIPIHKIKI